MSVLQTPIGAFTDGNGQAFALFNRSEVARCATAPACPADVPCDSGRGRAPASRSKCRACRASPRASPAPARAARAPRWAAIVRIRTSINDGGPVGAPRLGPAHPGRCRVVRAARRVSGHDLGHEQVHEPHRAPGRRLRWHGLTARATTIAARRQPTGRERVFIWGRPNFVGAKARNREAQLYFAVADMPGLDAAGAPIWSPRYFAGLDDHGRPRFVSEQGAAVPLDLSGGAGDPHETFDIINQMRVSWIEPIQRWVMVYGGDLDIVAAGYYNPGVTRGPTARSRSASPSSRGVRGRPQPAVACGRSRASRARRRPVRTRRHPLSSRLPRPALHRRRPFRVRDHGHRVVGLALRAERHRLLDQAREETLPTSTGTSRLGTRIKSSC